MVTRYGVGFLLGLLMAATGCDGASKGPDSTGLEFDLRREGPFNTGYLEWEITYTPLEGGATRTIPVHVWYPTSDDESATGQGRRPSFKQSDGPIDTIPGESREALRLSREFFEGDARCRSRSAEVTYYLDVVVEGDDGNVIKVTHAIEKAHRRGFRLIERFAPHRLSAV